MPNYDQQLIDKKKDLGVAWQAYRDFKDGLPENESAWTEEQRGEFDRLDKDVSKLDGEIQTLEKAQQRDQIDKDREERFERMNRGFETDGDLDGESRGGAGSGQGDSNEEIRSNAWAAFCRGGMPALTSQELRAFQADSDTEGGYLLAPQRFIKRLIKNADRDVFMRQLATVQTVTGAGDSIGSPTLTNDAEDWDWTAELATGNEEDTLRFGLREMRAHPMAKRVKISKTLIRNSAMSADDIVLQRMSYKQSGTMEKHYLTGHGARQPLGVFTASDQGVPTSRDVSTDNTTTAFTANGLINAEMALRPMYRRNGVWMFHTDGIKMARKLVDGDSQYIWRPGLEKGQVSTLLGRRYIESEWAPNTFTAGLYVGIIADFSWYWILDSLAMSMQVLDQLYAESNQMGYIGRYEGDGMPVLAEAFARVKLAAS